MVTDSTGTTGETGIYVNDFVWQVITPNRNSTGYFYGKRYDIKTDALKTIYQEANRMLEASS